MVSESLLPFSRSSCWFFSQFQVVGFQNAHPPQEIGAWLCGLMSVTSASKTGISGHNLTASYVQTFRERRWKKQENKMDCVQQRHGNLKSIHKLWMPITPGNVRAAVEIPLELHVHRFWCKRTTFDVCSVMIHATRTSCIGSFCIVSFFVSFGFLAFFGLLCLFFLLKKKNGLPYSC